MTYKVEVAVSIDCQLGECPIWDDITQTLLWTDIQASKLFRYSPQTQAWQSFVSEERIGSFALTQEPNKLLVAFASGLAYWNLATNAVEWRVKIDADLHNNRLNDGRCDAAGRFWVGSMNENSTQRKPSGHLFSFSEQEGLRQLESAIYISNGLCFSPDGKWMYFADSYRRKIWQYPYDALSGHIGRRKEWVETAANAAPDGSAVDANGNIWNAQWGASQVVCYSPSGEVIDIVPLPVSQPSCVAFGGADLNQLYVTTARQGLSDSELLQQPLAGSVLVVELPIQGLAEHRFSSAPTV